MDTTSDITWTLHTAALTSDESCNFQELKEWSLRVHIGAEAKCILLEELEIMECIMGTDTRITKLHRTLLKLSVESVARRFDASCGTFPIAVILGDWKLQYTFGMGRCGQLGKDDTMDQPIPRKSTNVRNKVHRQSAMWEILYNVFGVKRLLVHLGGYFC